MYGEVLIKCPMCKSKTFNYVSYSEEMWGTVEQHGFCDRCGFIVEQAYSEPIVGFIDVYKGFKNQHGNYVAKNIRKHKRIRRKMNITGCPINGGLLYI